MARVVSSGSLAAVVVATAFVLYLPSLANPLIWDDELHVPAMQQARWTQAFARENGAYRRPLVLLSYRLQHALGAGDPRALHAVNVGVHGANGALLGWLLVRLGMPVVAAFAAAVVFVAHPLQSAVVAYVSGRTDLLAVFFSLAALHFAVGAFAGGDAAPRRRRAVVARALVVASAVVCAGLAKESGVLGGAVVAAFWWWWRGRGRERGREYGLGRRCEHDREGGPERRRERELAHEHERGRELRRAPRPEHSSHGLVVAAGAVVAAVATVVVVAPPALPAALGLPVAVRMRAAGSALAAYAPLVGWPSELHLDRFAPVGGTWAAVLGAAFVVGAVAVVLSFVLRPTLVRLGFVVLAAALLPASNLVPVYPAIAESWVFAGEQLMYAPLGVLAALAVGAFQAGVTVLGARGSGAGRETTRLHPDSARPAPSATAAPMPRSPIAGDDPTALSRRRAKTIPTVATIATAVVAGVFIAAAAPAVRARQHDLGDAERTYRATLERSPSPRACFNLGVALLARGDARGAAEVYEQCALISPNDGAVFVQLGVAHHRAGERNKAEIAYGTALRLTPDDPYAWSNYAALDASAGSYAEARRKWERALEIEPGFAPAVEGLAKLDAIESPRRERVPRPPS